MRNNPGGNWTPGPWEAEIYCVWAGGRYIAGTQTGIGQSNQEANTHLIAAAPEMYDALKLALKAFKKKDWLTTDGAMSEIIETVLDKAEGRQE